MNTPDLHQLTGAYALDALDDRERAEFEAHLPDCPECRDEVAELRATAARLAVLSAEPAPASLRDSVLAQAAATRQEPPLTVVGPDRSERKGSTWRTRIVMPVAAALLGVLALTLGAWGLHQRDRADRLTARADLVASVIAAPDATSTSRSIAGGRASLVASPSTGQAVLVGSGLSAPADGKVYELWRIGAGGTPVPAGTYVPNSDGVVAVPIDGSLEGVSAIAVTVEPAGGSDQPTSAPIAAFVLPT